MSEQFDDREAADYLLANPKYLLGRLGQSKIFPDKVFWNTTGSENRADFPTLYFPKEWFAPIVINVPKAVKSLTPNRENSGGGKR